MLENKFERRFPTHQNAIDIFSDRWASKIEEVYPGLTSGPGPISARAGARRSPRNI